METSYDYQDELEEADIVSEGQRTYTEVLAVKVVDRPGDCVGRERRGGIKDFDSHEFTPMREAGGARRSTTRKET